MPWRSDQAAVVVGVDGSRNSIVAAEVALAEAERRHLPLRIVHAPHLGHPQSNPPHMPATVAQFIFQAHKIAPGLVIEERVMTVPPSMLLLDEADHAAVLVLGTQGVGETNSAAGGSTRRAVEAVAPCPVLVVPLQPTPRSRRPAPA